MLLNKADQINSYQQLMRVYGALTWSLGRALTCPEVCRIYTGSFKDGPFENTACAELFHSEQKDLFDVSEI